MRVDAGDWIGSTLEKDEELRSSFNRQVEHLVEQFGPILGKFVSDHIEGTVKGWNAKAMSTLIEENSALISRISASTARSLAGSFLLSPTSVLAPI